MRPPLDGPDSAPFLVFWETTRACDLVCLHCRACAIPDRDPRELSTAEGRALLDDVRAMGTPVVVLTGGDPARREDLVALVRHGADIGLRMALTPSATPLVTPDLLARLRDAGLARLAISMDGAGPATHDAFRGVPGSFARTMDILATARALGIPRQVNTTLTAPTRAELPAIAALVAEIGVELWSVFVVVPTGRAGREQALDATAVEETLAWLATLAAGASFDVKTTAAPHYRRVLLQRHVRRDDVVGLRDGIGRAPRGVNDGQGIAFVSHLGEVSPSGFLPIPCGTVRDQPLSAIYRTHPLFQRLRDPDQLGGKCGACEFRRVCGGSRARAWAVSGDPFAEDPGCAWIPRTRRAA
jgi:radical SAM protein